MYQDKLRLNYSIANADAAYTWQYLDIDLSVARTNVVLPLLGDFLQVPVEAFDGETTISTTLTVGNAFIKFDSQDGVPYFLKSGAIVNMARAPFGKLLITNAAQEGKMMRIYASALADSQPQAREIELATDSYTTLGVDQSLNDVTDEASLIVAVRDNRKSLLIQNLDPSIDLYLIGTDQTHTYDEGIKIDAGGGIFTIDNYAGVVFGITESGTIAQANVRVSEGY